METDFTIVPYKNGARPSLPNLKLLLRQDRPGLKTTLSVIGLIGECHYVEIYANRAKDTIKLVPVKIPTAYARSVTCDAVSHGFIAGANVLINELGYKLGKYEQVDRLTFKYAGKSREQQ